MDTSSFIIDTKTEDFYKDIVNNVEKRFDTSNYKIDRALPTGKNEKNYGIYVRQIRRKKYDIICIAQTKIYSYLMDDYNSDIKAKGTKKCVIKRMMKFNDYKSCLYKTKIMKKSNRDVKVKHMMYILKKSIKFH